MATINETVTSLSNFVERLFDFAVANGWTSDHLDTGAGKAAMSLGSVYVSFRWATSSPTVLGVYQALGFVDTSTDPGNHTDDSGNGAVSGVDATIAGQRRALITNTPVQWWGFTDGATYLHAVVQTTSTPHFVHLGFGNLDKIGDWTGGEYCYAQYFDDTQTSTPAVFVGQTVLLDGRMNNSGGTPANPQLRCGTIHVEGLPNEGGSSKWGVIMGNQPDANLGTDRGSAARVLCPGGFRAGPVARTFGRFSANSEKGLIPLYPILVLYRDKVTATSFYTLGWQPDVRGVNIEFYGPGDSIEIGADTWVVFPSYRKAATSTAAANTSGYQGVAYRVV
jgi:hypothetical protein